MNYEIYFDQDKGYVIMNWSGYATSIQFREGTEYMLKVLVENNASRVLANTKDMVLIGTEDQKWIETTFLPRAVKLGFRAIAVIQPTSYFNQVAMDAISFKIDKEKTFRMKIVDNKEEAEEWLTNIK